MSDSRESAGQTEERRGVSLAEQIAIGTASLLIFSVASAGLYLWGDSRVLVERIAELSARNVALAQQLGEVSKRVAENEKHVARDKCLESNENLSRRIDALEKFAHNVGLFTRSDADKMETAITQLAGIVREVERGQSTCRENSVRLEQQLVSLERRINREHLGNGQ